MIKINKKLIKKGHKIIKEEGLLVFLKKSIFLFFNLLKELFHNYIHLKYLLLFSFNEEITKEIQGNKMILDLKDRGISRELALYGVHEKASTEQIKKLLAPGMKIVEIGANIGYYLLMEAKLIGKEGYIYAFEPSPYNLNLLRRNINLNNYHNVEIHQKAVGSQNKKAKFYIANRSNLSGFIKRENMKYMYRNDGDDIIKVDVIKLDNFLKEKKIDLIRMDIEGFEKEALKGMETVLSGKNPPRYFFIEVHSKLLHKKNSSGGEIVKYMERFGYLVIKSFFGGRVDIAVSSTQKLLKHPRLEKGYWETFFQHK